MDDFWNRYQKDLKEGYFRIVDGKKAMKPEFIVEYSAKIARRLEHDKKNKLSQLWKFYDHTLRIQKKLLQCGEQLEVMYAELSRLRPAVHYAKERDTVTWQFKNFIDFNIEAIRNNDDLKAFIEHFQAVLAYLPRQNQK